MFNFIKIQFDMGRIDAVKVASFVPKLITAEEFETITGEKCKGE